ncbi:MAG: MBL fold metallo-hydrolase [Candidatus Pacearchaeota archaeon]
MIQQITKNVLKFSFREFSSNCYLVENRIMIDTGSIEARAELLEDFEEKNLKLENVEHILLTHLHWDHIGNIALFPKAKVYASAREIEDFKKNKRNFLRKNDLSELENVNFLDINEFKNKNFKIIEVPGHTRGSLAFLYKNILFSGDTIFDKKGYFVGRTDLKTSVPEEMQKSIRKLLTLKYEILCPGH